MTSQILFKYDVISDFHFVTTAKTACNRNFIVSPLFLNELTSNLVQEVKIKSLLIFGVQNNFSSLFITNEITFTQFLVVFEPNAC